MPLRELTAADVRSALIMLATTRAIRTVSMAHAALTRAVRHAEASDKVRRNVAALIDSPSGVKEGRLVGHSSTLVTQTVYRDELRPVVTSGAEMMDRIFADGAK